jgi:hypothetical protein
MTVTATVTQEMVAAQHSPCAAGEEQISVLTAP